MRKIVYKDREIDILILLRNSAFTALGPLFGLLAYFLGKHPLIGVAIGVFLSAFLNQFFGANKKSNDGTSSVAGSEGSGSSVGIDGSSGTT